MSSAEAVNVGYARRGDTGDIVGMFEDEYDTYYGNFVDEEDLMDQIIGMHQSIERGEVPDEEIFVVRDGGEAVAVAAASHEGGWSEIKSEMVHPDYRGEDLDGESFFRKVLEKADGAAVDKGQNRYSVCVSNGEAKTQKAKQDMGYVPVGYGFLKHFVTYDGKGRESTAFMVDGDFSEEGEVYVTGALTGAVDQALENLEGHGVDRTVIQDKGGKDQYFDFKKKEIPDFDMAKIEAVPIGQEPVQGESIVDYQELVSKVEAVENDPQYDWVGVSLNANHPSTASLTEEFMDMGFTFERFQPDGMNNASSDVLGLQAMPEEEWKRQVTEDTYQIIQETPGLDARVENTQNFSGTKVHDVRIES
ncbi:MAG: hypothetical protein ABEJ93_02530 [Candidatus Nanohalobium sp.]